ncbi:MAG: PQQ-binding-like beta-propeller repeat protein [Cellulomonas sp.]
MRSPRSHLQDVVLVDVVEDGSARPADPPPGQRQADGPRVRTRGRWHGARRWWPLLAGLALVLVVGTDAVLTARGERTRLATLAGIPGILAPLDGRVDTLWSTELTSGSSLAASGGDLVGVVLGHDGRVDVVGVDAATGQTAWRVPARPPGAVQGWASCAVPAPAVPGPAAVVACVIADEVVITAENVAGYVYYPKRAHLLVIETGTGTVVSDTPTDPTTSVVAFGEDLVTSTVDADGYAHLSRTDARGTTTRWTFTSADPVPVDDSRQRVVTVTVVDGRVVVNGGPTWVLSGDGEVLHLWTRDPSTALGGDVEVLHGGRLITEPVAGAVRRASGTRVLDLSSADSFVAAGHPAFLQVDDGSLADLVLLRSAERQSLIAYDLGSGKVRWTAPDTAGGGTAVIGGRVLRTDAGRLESLDGATGSVVWETALDPAGQAGQSPLLTDGRVLVLTVAEPARPVVLAAYGLDDGRRRWATAVPDDLIPVSLGRHLYGWTRQQLIGFG